MHKHLVKKFENLLTQMLSKTKIDEWVAKVVSFKFGFFVVQYFPRLHVLNLSCQRHEKFRKKKKREIFSIYLSRDALLFRQTNSPRLLLVAIYRNAAIVSLNNSRPPSGVVW